MAKKAGEISAKTIRFLTTHLTLLFLALRACDVIQWPWYWVLSPLVLNLCVYVLSCLLVGCVTIWEKS